MLDSQARLEARAISLGAPAEQATGSKVALYGLVARTLNPAFLPDNLKLTTDHKDFKALREILGRTLTGSAQRGYKELSEHTQNSINEHLNSHFPLAVGYAGSLAASGLTRIYGGCGTAATSEIITLRTIAQKQSTGEKISLKGLYASAKVPLRIAMMQMSDFGASRDPDVTGTAQRHYDIWDSLSGGDDGLVFKAEDVSLDSERGLRLINVHDGLASEDNRLERGAHIGCPATLVIGYISKVHTLAVNAALDAGLLEAY